MSVLLFPPKGLEDPGWLTALAAVSVAEVVMMGDSEPDQDGRRSPTTRVAKPGIKWPNDVRVDGRKVAGILLERGHGTVIGIGLNVNIDPGDFPSDLRSPATSLRALHGRRLDRSAIVRNLIRRLDRNYDLGIALGRDHLGGTYRELSEHHRHRVEITVGHERHVGRLAETDLEVGLTLVLDDGRPIVIPTDEVASIATLPGSVRWGWDDYDDWLGSLDTDRRWRGD